MLNNTLFQNLINYQRKQAIVTNVIKRTKRDYWRTYCDSLDINTPFDRVWNMIKIISGIGKEYGYPTLYDDE